MAKPTRDRYEEVRPEVREDLRRVALEIEAKRASQKMRASDYFWGNEIHTFDIPGGHVKWYRLSNEDKGWPADLAGKTDDPCFRRFLQIASSAPTKQRRRRKP